MSALDLGLGSLPEHRSVNLDEAEAVFDVIEEETPISHEGRQWLECVLDPFHDKPQFIAGQPSYDQAVTIVQAVTREISIERPATASDTDNWDCHIFSTQTSTTELEGLGGIILSGPNWEANSNQVGQSGAVMAVSVPMGTPIMPVADTNLLAGDYTAIRVISPVTMVKYLVTAPPEFLGMTYPDSPYLNGKCRVIGQAFEVVNESKILEVGGSVTVYKLDTQQSTSVGYQVNLTTANRFYETVRTQAMPPSTLAEATNIPNSQTWHSGQGCYCVQTLAGWDNSFSPPQSTSISYSSTEMTPGSGTGLIGKSQSFHMQGASGLAAFPRAPSYKKLNNFLTSGAYFVNLPPDTVLRLRLRTLIERAPSLKEQDLLVLASPSPEYDPYAWELYSRAARDLPAGVPLNENAMGDWFRKVAGTFLDAYDIAGPMMNQLAPLGGPKAIMANELLGKGRELIDREKLRTPKKERGPTKKSMKKGFRKERKERVKEARQHEAAELRKIARKVR